MPLSHEGKRLRDARHRHNAFYDDVERMRMSSRSMQQVRTTSPRAKDLARQLERLANELREALRERIDN